MPKSVWTRQSGQSMNHLITRSRNELLLDYFCTHCGNPVTAEDNFCRNCGSTCCGLIPIKDNSELGLGASNIPNQTAVVGVADPVATVLNNRLLVIGVIAMIGPLGLPALWFSQRFSKSTKVVTTVVYMLVTTIVPLVFAWYIMDYSLRPLVEAFSK